MKNLYFFFLSILLLTGCDLNPNVSTETTYSVKVTCDSNGTVSPTILMVEKGEDARIYLNPFPGYEVKAVLVNGQSISIPDGNILTLRNINSDMKVEVIMAQKSVVSEKYYKVYASSTSGGTISPFGEIKLKVGESKNFTITASSNYLIDSLLIDEQSMDITKNLGTYSFSYKANDTLSHTIRVVYRIKKVYTVKTVCDEWSTIYGNTSFYEGGSTTLRGSAKDLCSVENVKVNGKTITGTSYTFTDADVNDNLTFEITSKREPEWFLCQGTWVVDSVYVNNLKFIYGDEKTIYYSNGYCDYIKNGKTFTGNKWSLDKSTNPIRIKEGNNPNPPSIIVLNEKQMVTRVEGTIDGVFKIVIGFLSNNGNR